MTEAISSRQTPPAFLVELFATIDHMDAAGYAAFFAPDAVWTFGNADPLKGRDAIAGAARGVFSVLTSISHGLHQSYETADGFITSGDVTYHRIDGKVLVLPFAGFFTMENNQITGYQTFMDGSPLFAGLGASV